MKTHPEHYFSLVGTVAAAIDLPAVERLGCTPGRPLDHFSSGLPRTLRGVPFCRFQAPIRALGRELIDVEVVNGRTCPWLEAA